MASSNINRVVLTGNLTHDPDLRSTGAGTAVCNLRIASTARRKDAGSGEWVDKANYLDVVVWGAQGENAARYLTKGRGVAIDGRLDWHEYETEGGSKRQAVQIIADHVQFLAGHERPAHDEAGQAAPAAMPPDDDIPF